MAMFKDKTKGPSLDKAIEAKVIHAMEVIVAPTIEVMRAQVETVECELARLAKEMASTGRSVMGFHDPDLPPTATAAAMEAVAADAIGAVDPWANRAQGMRCSTCIWFVKKGVGPVGRCRRHAPTMGGYPVVYPNDWCGDHRLEEGKLPNG